jgi:hypothetical protein
LKSSVWSFRSSGYSTHDPLPMKGLLSIAYQRRSMAYAEMSPQGLRQRPRQKRDRLARTRARPRPEQWGDDEAMTLIEAVTVFFPTGPLTLSSLRTEVRERRLAVARVARKVLTTPRAIKQVTPCLAAKQSRRVSTSEENVGLVGAAASG